MMTQRDGSSMIYKLIGVCIVIGAVIAGAIFLALEIFGS